MIPLSWTLYGSAVPKDEAVEKLTQTKDAQLAQQPFDSWDDPVEEQMQSAFRAVEALLSGIDEEKVNLSLSGHAVTGPATGSTNSISVSVSGVPKPPEKKEK